MRTDVVVFVVRWHRKQETVTVDQRRHVQLIRFAWTIFIVVSHVAVGGVDIDTIHHCGHGQLVLCTVWDGW